jgi:hypothetical protein
VQYKWELYIEMNLSPELYLQAQDDGTVIGTWFPFPCSRGFSFTVPNANSGSYRNGSAVSPPASLLGISLKPPNQGDSQFYLAVAIEL